MKARRTEGPTARPAWEWILLALCLWSALQRGTALVLKGNLKGTANWQYTTIYCCMENVVFAL